jgi:hypothetical protein
MRPIQYPLSIAILMFLLLGSAKSLSAQDDAPIFVLQDRALLTINGAGEASIVADLAASPLTVTSLDNDNHRLVALADISKTADKLFTLIQEGQLSPQLLFPTRTYLAETNLETGISRTILDRPGIFAFVVSPDEHKMLVGYYEDEYYFSAQRSCVLVIATGVCSPTPHQIFATPGSWIDNNTYLVVSLVDNMLHVTNIRTGNDQVLPIPQKWVLNSAIPIPQTRLVLASAGLRDFSHISQAGFLTINLDTLEVRELPYIAEAGGNYSEVSAFSFSPDNRYLLYGGTHRALVEFNTGMLVRELETVVNSGWIDEHTLVVQGRLNENSQMEIAEVDALTGNTVQIASGDQATGILLVPEASR